jgi:1-aminocyclopropane-1-carboxylate deaminase/D-cysteine desulfhydrase-like pyridoxal-dependent ACC family enzyme
VYTAKAFHGLLDTLRRAPRAFGHRVCFIHTGGVFSIFPARRALAPLLDAQD